MPATGTSFQTQWYSFLSQPKLQHFRQVKNPQEFPRNRGTSLWNYTLEWLSV